MANVPIKEHQAKQEILGFLYSCLKDYALSQFGHPNMICIITTKVATNYLLTVTACADCFAPGVKISSALANKFTSVFNTYSMNLLKIWYTVCKKLKLGKHCHLNNFSVALTI